jgi:hypothetical protein
VDAVEELGVLLGDEVLKRKIEQALEKAFTFGQAACFQNVRGVRHGFASKIVFQP